MLMICKSTASANHQTLATATYRLYWWGDIMDDGQSAAAQCRRQHQYILAGSTRVGNTSVLPVTVVRDLGAYLDADVTVSAHVTATVGPCFAALRQIRSVVLTDAYDALITLIHEPVITKLDFCCSALTGVSGSLMQRLQSVLNAAARVFSARAHNSTPPWTPLAESSGENSISAVRSGASLSSWHGATMPGWVKAAFHYSSQLSKASCELA